MNEHLSLASLILLTPRRRIGTSVLPDYLWAVCGRPERLTRVAHGVGRAFVACDAHPPAVHNFALWMTGKQLASGVSACHRLTCCWARRLTPPRLWTCGRCA